MILSTYSEKLRHSHTVGMASAQQLVRIVAERQSLALFDGNIVRFGVYERRLLDEIVRSLGLCRLDEISHVALCRLPKNADVTALGTSPREVYETYVMGKHEATTSVSNAVGDVMRVRPLGEGASEELAFAVLDNLQTKCALVALGVRQDANGDCLDNARQTALLAEQLFEKPVTPAIIDDWGRSCSEDLACVSLSVSKPLVEFLRETVYMAAQDLRLMFGESEGEQRALAMDVWRAYGSLFSDVDSHVSPLSPVWWMRPTYRLRCLFDEIGVTLDRVFEPFDISEEGRASGDAEVEELSLTLSSVRGLAVICGMILARATLSEIPGYVSRKMQLHGDGVDLGDLAELHRTLLEVASLS